MPYRRKRYYKKRPYRRKKTTAPVAWYNKKYSTADIAKSAWSTAKWLKSMVNVEKLLHEVAVSANPNTTGTVTHLTAISQSDTQSGRTGNSIKIVSLNMSFFIRRNSGAGQSALRFCIVRDNQQVSDTAPSFTDVFSASNTYSLLNAGTLGRFSILMDRKITLDDAGQSMVNLVKNINLNHHVRYNGTSGTDQQKGALYLLLVSNEATATPSVEGTIRVRYIDN